MCPGCDVQPPDQADDRKQAMRSCNRIVNQLELMQNGVGVEFSLHRVVEPVLD
jgi:hypothetical protein